MTTLTGPVLATQKLLECNRVTIDDRSLIGISEAFASVMAAWRRQLEPDMDGVNVNGSAFAIGHPLGLGGGCLVARPAPPDRAVRQGVGPGDDVLRQDSRDWHPNPAGPIDA